MDDAVRQYWIKRIQNEIEKATYFEKFLDPQWLMKQRLKKLEQMRDNDLQEKEEKK